MLILVVAAIVTLAVPGPAGQTSRRDVQFDAGAPVVGTTSTTAKPGARRSTRHPGAATLTPRGARPPVSAAEVRLQTAMGRALSAAGPASGALVYDLGAHTELYSMRPAVMRPPASVEKLWTTTALMLTLGPDARMHTTVLGSGSLRNGVWHGDLYLHGGGDPTFGDPTFNGYWNHGDGPTAGQLAAQLVRRGIRRVTGRVYADESLFDRRRGGLLTDYLPDTPDFGGQLSALTYDHGTITKHYSPATIAARELVYTMLDAHIAATASRHERDAPAGAQTLATVSSPPLSVMTRLMDVPSDDLFAEMFTKQLGVTYGGGGTISAGARVIAQTIADQYALHPKILDGSGLSRDDRSSPLEVVDLLHEVWGTRVGRELVDSLPTVGVDGTVQGIAVKTAAKGRCVAKTGTLNGVTNLAGYCAGLGHHALAFALFIDGPPNWSAITLEGRMVGAIARY